METLRQQMLKSLRAEGVLPRIVVSNPETAADWLIRIGPIAAKLNRESKRDPGGEAA